MFGSVSRVFGRIPIAGRLALLAVGAAVCLAIQALIGARALTSAMLNERKAKLVAQVDMARGVVTRYRELAAAGSLPTAEAQRTALDVIRSLRGSEDAYVWINDVNGKMLLHPAMPEREGLDHRDYLDPTGKPIFAEFIANAQAHPVDGAFVSYRWPKPGTETSVAKLAFVRVYQPWGWVLGSGVYLDRLEAALRLEQERTVALSVANLLFFLTLAFVVGRSVRQNVEALRLSTTWLETSVREGRLAAHAPLSSVSYEFRGVVEGMNRTMDAFSVRVYETAAAMSLIADGQVPDRIDEEWPGEFEGLRACLNGSVQALKALVEDVRMLTSVAAQGELGVRADPTRHQGEFRAVIEGVNGTLEAALSPVLDATRMLDSLARGDLNARLVGNFEGDHARLQEGLNNTVEALHQAQRMEAVGSLAAGVAHEINTPVQYVSDNVTFLNRAFTQLSTVTTAAKAVAAGADAVPDLVVLQQAVKRSKLDYLLAQVPRALEQSREGLARIASIVGAMKDFAHKSADEQEPVNLTHAVETTLMVASNEWKYVATVDTHFDPNLPPIPALRNELNQVILIVVVNAAQAIAETLKEHPAEKGVITITTRREGPWAVIEVADTGPGMSNEVRDRVFDPFFTTKPVGKGSGQGLAIAYNIIVKRHGGRIEVQSELGKGATFVVRLPIDGIRGAQCSAA
jgi:signal transduction histidine kinase